MKHEYDTNSHHRITVDTTEGEWVGLDRIAVLVIDDDPCLEPATYIAITDYHARSGLQPDVIYKIEAYDMPS
jgi:hypothetical protein